MAVIPGVTLMKLWDSLGYVEDALKIVSAFVVLVGFVAMLIALYTSLQERRREMAILRVLGAGPQKILFLLVLESTFLTSMGLLCGISLIYLLLFMGQPLIESRFGLFVPIKIFSAKEIVTAAIMLLGGLLIGFVPAFKAYKNTLSDGLTIRT